MSEDREGRQRTETVPELIPKLEVDLKIQNMATVLRSEWQLNIDRQAIDAVAKEAAKASEHSMAAVKTSHRRWMTILLVLFALAVVATMQFVYAQENRLRIEHLERLSETQPGGATSR